MVSIRDSTSRGVGSSPATPAKKKVMNMRTTLTEKGFWCPNCGEFIKRDELDCDDIYDLQQHGDVLHDCPYCGESFWLENCAESDDN